MITATLNSSPESFMSPRSLIRQGWGINRSLTAFILICLGVTLAGIFGALIDPRTLNGQSVWIKPAKFGISNAIYCATILMLFGSIQPRPRWVTWIFNLTSGTLVIGMSVVALQAARGVKSHYNFATPFDTAVLSAMGLSTLTLSIVSLIGCVLLVRQPMAGTGNTMSRSVIWGVKLGMLTTVLVGFGVGPLMLRPSDSQMAKMRAGAADAGSAMGAHTIGAEDGGPGLPILGWSTTDGDLRPAHFFGLHALQIVPLLGLFVARRREQWLGEGHRMGLVVIGGGAYIGFVGLTAWQALQGEPIISPSATTLTAFAALIAATAFAVGTTLLHARRTTN